MTISTTLIGKIKKKYNFIKSNHQKRKTIKELIKPRNLDDKETITLNRIWRIEKILEFEKKIPKLEKYNIFGTPIDLNNINWHKDYVSDFEYPLKRFNKIKISKWFDKGIDVKFPWEVSRFYFAIKLAQNYVITKDEKYYSKFKELILDWINKNPFCYGVNWFCTMEVAIRAINWIVAINLFDDIFQKDEGLKKIISKSLIQHAEYISLFPETYNFNQNKHTSNHTTADYTGLLFLSLIFKGHNKSKKWLSQAITGLEGCVKYQTYKDGVNFEASIPYHRLVLEMFAYSAIICKANGIKLSNNYYELLFKMFEYTAAYMDHNGNAPQVGDNDSGRILIFHDSDEHDHSYLLDLGERIFDYKFKSQCEKRNSEFKQWLPKIEKININGLNINPRKTDKSIIFKNGGAYFLKNDIFSLLVTCFPIGQNGKGGHNHLDNGSYTLSLNGEQIIVDPGTYTYTRSFNQRNNFRDYLSHNVVITEKEKKNKLNENRIWNLQEYFKCEILNFDNNSLKIKIINKETHEERYRIFILSENKLRIIDEFNGEFESLIHFKSNINIKKNNKCLTFNNFKICLHKNIKNDTVNSYIYSNSYGIKEEAKLLKLCSTNNIGISYYADN